MDNFDTMKRRKDELVAREHRKVRDGAIPPLPGLKGRSYYAQDSDGQWYYLNHADTWQTCPPPISHQEAAQIAAKHELAALGVEVSSNP